MPELRVIYRSSVLKGRALTLRDPILRIGRDPSCQILFDEIADRVVSRLHAEIRWNGTTPSLTPTQGRIVFINGTPISGTTRLSSGDLIELSIAGGPSVEVRYGAAESVTKPSVAVDSPVAEARTIIENVPDALKWNAPKSGAVKSQPSLRDSLPPTDDPAAINSPQAQFGTQLLTAAEALGEPDSRPVPPKERPRWLIPAGLVLLVVVAVGVLWAVHLHNEHVREAVARVEAMLAAEQASGVAPEVSEEDLRLFEEEVAAKRHAPAPIPLHHPRPPHMKASDVDAEPAEYRKVTLTGHEHAIRDAFAAYQRARLARLSMNRPRDHHEREKLKELIADVRRTQAAYETAVRSGGGNSGDAIDQVIRRTARALGECDGAIPHPFHQELRATLQSFLTSKARLDVLTSTLKRASDYRYGPTITAALADEQLPVELFFIPAMESNFDPNRVAPVGDRGIAKGMWQLLPEPAAAMGLRVGRAATSFDRDPTDDREEYEREIRFVSRALRPVYLHRAAGSALLIMATYDHGNEALLESVRQQAGVGATDTDPGSVSFWRLYESGTVSEAVRNAALDEFATVAIGMNPATFGLRFPPPLEHVSLAESE